MAATAIRMMFLLDFSGGAGSGCDKGLGAAALAGAAAAPPVEAETVLAGSRGEVIIRVCAGRAGTGGADAAFLTCSCTASIAAATRRSSGYFFFASSRMARA